MFYAILHLEMMNMEIKTGYLYHIKDEYFYVVNDDSLMQKHEKVKRDQHTLLFKIKTYYDLYL